MRSISRQIAPIAGLTLCLMACAPATSVSSTAPVPRRSEIFDGTIVRARIGDGAWIEGRARGFAATSPFVIGDDGDSVAVTCAHQLEVRELVHDHGMAGALTGLLVGTVVSASACWGQKYCGEQDPTPALATVVGFLVGRLIRTVDYRQAERGDCAGGTPSGVSARTPGAGRPGP